MKKLFAFLMIMLLMAISCSAVAETDSQTYTNTTYGYHIDYPSGWIPLDKDTIDYYLQQITSGAMSAEGLTSSALEAIKLSMSITGEDSLIEFLDLRGNTITVTCLSFPTPSSVELAKAGLAPQLIAVYETMFTDMEVLDSGSVATMGDKDYLKVAFTTSISNQLCAVELLYYFQNDLIYNFCFTWVSTDPATVQELEQIKDNVMNSFVLDV